MTESSNDAALIQVLVERLEKIRLPIALELKEKVDRGEVLNDREIEYLEEVLGDVNQVKPLLDRHPEWQELAARMTTLYSEITTKALENERK
ncbi:MAG: hypothetical protein WBN81_01865 [Gammaproteobacteria bacterium]